MGWLIALIQIHAVVRVITILAALVGIAWSLRTMWRVHVATARQRQEDAAKRRQGRIRPRSARQPIATPAPSPTPPPDDPRQEDLLSALASQETGRMPAMDLGHAETRRLGAPDRASSQAESEDSPPEGHDTRYPIDGGAVTRRDLRPPPKDASTQILREAAPQGIDGNLQAAIRDAVEDSLREDGSETFFKDFADAEHGGEPAAPTTTIGDDDEEAAQDHDIGAETTNRMPPADTDEDEDDEAAATSAPEDEDSSDDTPVDDGDAGDDDLESRRRRRRVSQEIIHHNAQRHEELGLHIGISPDSQMETEDTISAEDKQRRLRQLGLAEASDDDDTPDPVADVMARVEAAISAMGDDEDDTSPAPSDDSAADQPSPDDDDLTSAEEKAPSTADDSQAEADEPAPDTTPAAPSLSVPDWARADTFDEDLEDDGGDAPRQHHLFD